MYKKTATILIIMMLAFIPSTAKADLDVISNVERAINSVTEKVNEVVKKYSTVQASLQELSLNRNIVSQLRDKIKSELTARATAFVNEVKDAAMAEGMMFLKTSLSSVSLPGIGQYVDMGAFVNPKLTAAVGQTYLKRQHKNDDIKYAEAMDARSNNLMVENASIIFANALVRRVQLIEEDPCHCVDDSNNLIPGMPKCEQKDANACKEQRDRLENMADVLSAQQLYFSTIERAHDRWLKIKEAQAAYLKMKAEGLMNQGNLDDVGDVTGVIDDTAKEKRASAAEVNDLMQKAREANTLALTNGIKSVVSDIKNGNITNAVANAVQTGAGAYSGAPGSREGLANTFNGIATGVGAANSAYNSAQSGDWGGALGNVASGTGNIIGGAGGNTGLGNAFNNAAGGGGAALNAALNGDWGGTISGASGAAGNVISGEGNGMLGAAISSGGSLTDVGIDAVNAGGNWSNVFDNTVGSGQAYNALDNLQNAYENKVQQEEQWQKAAEEVKSKQEEQLKNTFEELQKKYKQEQCSRCNAENEARAKSGQPMISCFAECS